MVDCRIRMPVSCVRTVRRLLTATVSRRCTLLLLICLLLYLWMVAPARHQCHQRALLSTPLPLPRASIESTSAGADPRAVIDSATAGADPRAAIDSTSAGAVPHTAIDSATAGADPRAAIDSITADAGADQRAAIDSTSAGADSHPVQLVLYWTPAFGQEDFALGQGVAPFAGCPESRCSASADRRRLPVASAVLLHGRSINMSQLPPRHSRRQVVVFALQESPLHTRLDLTRLRHFFNLTMTYSWDADVYHPYAEVVPGRQPGQVPHWHRRRRVATWLVSNCGADSSRDRLVESLRARLDVSQLGACGGQPAPLACLAGRVACYQRLAQSYLFYLAFENSLCDDYITEKFWLPLQTGMVPVVMGATVEQYRRVAPPHSFIHVDEFASVEQLADFVTALSRNRTAYGSFQAWRRRYQVVAPRPGCRLCQLLHAGVQHRQSSTVDLPAVWSADSHCRMSALTAAAAAVPTY